MSRIRVTRLDGTVGELHAVAELLTEYLAFYDRAHDHEEVLSFLQRRQERSESLVFIAWHDDADQRSPIGVAQVYPTFSTLSLGEVWVLNDLFVSPAMRGRAVGRCLVRAVCDDARQQDVTEVTLETHVENHAARSLYGSEGFETDERFVHYSLALR